MATLAQLLVFLDCCRVGDRDYEPQGRRSLFTDPLFPLKSPPSARDKNKNSGEFIKEKSDKATSVYRLGRRNTQFRSLKGFLTIAPYQLRLNLTVSSNFSRKNTTLRDKLQEQISLIAAHLDESALFLGESALFLCEFALFSSTALPVGDYNFFFTNSQKAANLQDNKQIGLDNRD